MEILALLSGLLQVGTGIWQAFKSDDLSKEERPVYTVPKEAEQALNVAKQQAYGTMPGYNQALGNIQQQEATSISKAKEVAQSGSDILGFISGQNLATNRALGGLDAANEQYKASGLRNLQGALGTRAAYSDKAFDINQMQPYLQAMQASSVMGEGAIQNIAGGVNAGISNYIGYKQNQDMMDTYRDIYGSGKQQTQPGTYNTWLNTPGNAYGDWLTSMLSGIYGQSSSPIGTNTVLQ
jgi:hypothetical protein